MAAEFIKPDELFTTYQDAKKFMLPLFEPFDEFERIARNRPHPGIAKDLPKVTDGTLASIIQEKPKRVIQQIPTGVIEASDEWLEIVAGFILTNEILPNAEEEAQFLQKCWAVVSKGEIYGSQPTFVRFLNRGNYFGTDFTAPYIKDVLLEPGKISDRASNVLMLRTWWKKSDIEMQLLKENTLGKRAQDRGQKYNSGWNLANLKKLIEEGPAQKDTNAQNPTEKGKQLNSGFYEIVHVFQRGIGGNFYSFAPQLGDNSSENLVRTKVNKDPRGKLPLNSYYRDQDMWNPLGRGAVEMSGGVQNLLDSEMQMYQYNRALMLNPPMKKRGNFAKANIKFVPNHIIDMGNEPTNDVEVLTIDSTAITNFPNNHGLLKSQILNLNNSLDTSISSEVGNPGFSKTDAGVHAMDSRLGISDNHTRKQFESWWQDTAETMVNLYFAEREGIQVLTLDEDTACKLKKVAPAAVGQNNQIKVNYSTETPKLKFQVDASSSNMKDNQAQVESATNLLEIVGKYPQLDAKNGGAIDTIELGDRIVYASGIEDPEKIIVSPEQGQEPRQPVMTPQMVQQMIQQAMQAEQANDPSEHPLIKLMATLNIKFTDLDAPTQRFIIQTVIGAPGTGPLPTEVDLMQRNADTTLKANAQQHQQMIDAADTLIKATQAKQQAEKDHKTHTLNAAGTALEVAKAVTGDQMAQRQQTQAEQQAEAEAAAQQEQPTTGVTNG